MCSDATTLSVRLLNGLTSTAAASISSLLQMNWMQGGDIFLIDLGASLSTAGYNT